MFGSKTRKRLDELEKQVKELTIKVAVVDETLQKMHQDIIGIMDVCTNLILCFTTHDDTLSVIMSELSGRKSTADPTTPKKPNLPN